jgi:hypothetical protein
MRAALFLAPALTLLAGVCPAGANDPFDPTGETVVVYIESVPPGAGIEFKGHRQKYETNAFVSFEVDYLRTIRIVLDGFEPCSSNQDRLPRDPKTGDLIFTCKLVRIRSREPRDDRHSSQDGPAGPDDE